MALAEKKTSSPGRLTIELVRPEPVLELIIEKPRVEDHLGLAHAVASQFVRKNERHCVRDSEEFAEACLALFRAANSYRGHVPFSSYAWQVMRNAILDLHKMRSRQVKLQPLDSAILENTVESTETALDPDCAAAMVYVLLENHDEESERDRSDKDLLKRVYLRGEKVLDLATELGVSHMTIYNRMNRAIEKIKERHGASYES